MLKKTKSKRRLTEPHISPAALSIATPPPLTSAAPVTATAGGAIIVSTTAATKTTTVGGTVAMPLSMAIDERREEEAEV